MLPLFLACNGIVGLSDYTRAECAGGGLCDGGDAIDAPFDAGADADRPDVRVDAAGTRPVSWAAWRMPNYDAGGPVDNPMDYALTADGIVDKVTTLVWRHPMPADALSKDYAGALAMCAPPWRLPSRIELVTLLDNSQPGARVNPVFDGVPQTVHWTFSDVRPVDPADRKHWVVDFGAGGVGQRAENVPAAVLCVKAGP